MSGRWTSAKGSKSQPSVWTWCTKLQMHLSVHCVQMSRLGEDVTGGDGRCQGMCLEDMWQEKGGAGEESSCGREGDDIGSWRKRKLQGEERVPEHILHLLVSKAASDFCLESQSPALILLHCSL